MNTQNAITSEQANLDLLAAAQEMVQAFENLTKLEEFDVKKHELGRVLKAHKELKDAATQSEEIAAITKSQR